MLNDNAFPNAGSITGSGGAQITGSGIFFYLDYGEIIPVSTGTLFFFQTGLLAGGQGFLNNSITGSGGAQITGSGIFLYLDYASPYDNGEFLTFEGTDVSGVPPPIISPFKPYAFYFKRK